MRIDCEQCGAAYSIDDALITERGVRAQCPKCAHQKVVKRATFNPLGSGPAPVTAVMSQPPAPNPFATTLPPNPFGGNPFGAPPSTLTSPPNPFAPPPQQPFAASAPPLASPFGAPPEAENPFASASAPAFGSNPFADLGDPPAPEPDASPFGAPGSFMNPPQTGTGDPSTSPFVVNPFAAPPSTSAPFPSSSPFPSAPFPSASAPPFGQAADPFASLGSTPPAPATPAADPFAALGASSPAVADPFSSGAGSSGPSGGRGSPAPSPPPAAAADPFAKLDLSPSRPADSSASPTSAAAPVTRWRVKTAAGMDAEVDLAQLRDLVRGGQVTGDDEAAPLGEPLKPVRAQPLLAASSAPRPASARAVVGARARSNPSLGRVAAALAIVAVVGGGASLVIFKPELFEKQTDAGINPLRRARPTWEKQFPEVGGTATEHVAAARAQMRLDTAAGYRKADDELRQALLLDVGHIGAIAGWVENFTNLPAVRADLETASLAQESIAYAKRREPEDAGVKRAQGALKLALGEVDEAQKILTEAQRASPDAETMLMLAKSHLDRNPADALALVQQVRSKDASLKYALVVEGAAQRRMGDFGAAVSALNARLADDPANTGALKELAKLQLDIGNPQQAIDALTKLLAAEDRDVEAHLMRAKIAYQILDTPGALAQAEGYLDAIITKHDTAAGELLLQVLSHAAYVEAELGNLDEGQKLAERARATDGSFAPALFVLGRIYALKGNFPDSMRALEQSVRAAQARDTFYEPVARAELARVQVLAGDAAAAIRNYEQVIEYDPRYARAHFGLASAYIQTDRATQAMTIMRRAFENDPAFEIDRRTLTDYPTPRRDLVAFADAFKQAKVPPGDESLGALKLAAEAMIRYHAGQKETAEQLARRAIDEDRFNLFALLYLGVIELDDGRAAEAKKHLRLAVETTGTPHAVMRLYLARAEMKTGDTAIARKRLQDLIDQEPTLVQAAYSLAMLLRQEKLEGQVRDELKKVILKDQDYIPAKRALAEGT